MSMTFGDILDAVLKDGLSTSRRADAKEWVRFRHAWIWGAADWTFKRATASITFTSGSQVLASADVPTDLHAVLAMYTAQGSAMRGIRDPLEFFDAYNTLYTSAVGIPEAYTVVNGQVLVGPQGDGSTGLVVYMKEKPTLSADTDPTGLPDGFDLALVHGGKAEGYKMTNIPLAADFDSDFQAAVQGMENDWLEQVEEAGSQVPAYRPGDEAFIYWR